MGAGTRANTVKLGVTPSESTFGSMQKRIKWRGGQVTRIEALTDAVFGFAITLLFVSFDIPHSFDAMLAPASRLCCIRRRASRSSRWCGTTTTSFSRRFDMDDGWTIFLNSVLLFVVLFYVYPLKFTFAPCSAS